MSGDAPPPPVRELTRKPSPEVVKQLEELLALAQDGKLRSLGIMAHRVGGGVYTAWSGDVDVAAMIHALEAWKLQILTDGNQGDVDLDRE